MTVSKRQPDRNRAARDMRRWRHERKKTAREMAALLEIYPQTYHQLEAGRARPTLRVAVMAERRLGIECKSWLQD